MIALRAPAKLTWFLEVTGRRDDGRHELRSEMCTLDLADDLVVDEAGDYLRLTGEARGVELDDTNLVARALRVVNRRAGVTLTKRIPAGGGLGGGSADAAAILRWAGGVTPDTALGIGGDVPFCQVGGRALVEGVGERVSPLAYEQRNVTLLLTGLRVDTGSCYRVYDELVLERGRVRGRNELTEAALVVEPRLALVLEWARATLNQEVTLAGSGSTLFVEGHLGTECSWVLAGPVGPVEFRHARTTPA